ncbi:MAG: response regulator [Proteobacteria bacterium]|nr:response regulator [Pseudomonadota bacterium]
MTENAKSPMKVLVVDDEETLRMLVGMTVESLGLEMIEAEDGKSALEAIKKNKVGFVVTDINMPGMSGLDFACILNKHAPHIEVIIVSGFLDAETKAKATACGVTSLISKPYDYGQMEDTIRQAAQRAIDKRKPAA